MTERAKNVQIISRRLFIALATLLCLVLATFYLSRQVNDFLAATPFITMIVGMIGGFVGIQQRLKSFNDEDLEPLVSSWVYALLAPLVGGILAMLLYVLFLSGLLAGELFPHFDLDTHPKNLEKFEIIFDTHGDFAAYAKLVFWSFVAGFSERFVIDIIGQFESKAENRDGK